MGDNSNFKQIKQAMFLFDTIGVPECTMIAWVDSQFEENYLFRQLEFLIKKQLIFDPMHLLGEVISDSKNLEIFNQYGKELGSALASNKSQPVFETSARLFNWVVNNSSLSKEIESIPLISDLTVNSQIPTQKSEVINILIENIPIPSELTAWEAILEFKSDPDNQGRLAALRNWVNKTISSNKNPSEIRDEIDDLLYRYRKSLEIHKITYHKGIFQTIVVSSLELLENALKLKLSTIATDLFKISQGDIDLMSVELNAPGNELAYIYAAQNKF